MSRLVTALLNIIPLYRLFSVSRCIFRLSHTLALVNNPAMNLGDQRPFQDSGFIFWVDTQNRIAGSYGSSIFNLWRHLLTSFHIGCNNYIFSSHPQCTRVPISLHPFPQRSLFSGFCCFIVAIRMGVRCYLSVVNCGC